MRCAFGQNRAGKASVILGALQHLGRGFVDLQEVPEVSIGVVPPSVEDTAKVDGFFLGEPTHEGWRRGAFEVEMQLDLGQRCEAHRKLRPGPWEATPRCAASEAATSTKPICPISRIPAPFATTGTRSRV